MTEPHKLTHEDAARRSLRRWYQFRLRTIFIGILALACLLVAVRAYVEPYRQQRQTMNLIQELGGSYQATPAETWQRWLLGDDHQNVALVDLADCDKVDEYLPHIRRLPRLETLVVGGDAFKNGHLEQLDPMTNLRGLVLDATAVREDALATWRRSHPLVEVYESERRTRDAVVRRGFDVLDWIDEPVPPQLASLAGAKSLFEKVRGIAADRRLEDDALADLNRFRKIESIDLRGASVSDEGLRRFAEIGTLEGIYLSGPSITDTGLSYLERLHSLRWLELEQTMVSDAGLEHLLGLKRLELIGLVGTEVTDAGMEKLVEMPSLRHISLLGDRITGSGLKHLQRLPRLEGLSLVKMTQINDLAMPYVAAMSGLNTLVIDEVSISDVGLWELHRLQKLQVLEVRDTRVTQEGVRRLQKSLSGCKITAP